jgi:RNA polymerase sigma-70 factor (ECF subfamily)
MERVSDLTHAEATAPPIEAQVERSPAVPAGTVHRAQQGDRDAFEEVFKASVAMVFRYAGAIVQDPARTEDVVAQVFLDAWRDLPRLRDPGRFNAWILRIAHNRSLDELRRPQPVPIENAAELTTPDSTEPEAEAVRSADRERLRQALLLLPDDQRQVITLRLLQGLRHDEVGRQMGRSEEASRALLHRALRRLRRILDVD